MRTPRCVFLMVMAVAALGATVAAAADAVLTTGAMEFSPSLSFNRSSFSPVGGGVVESVTHLSFEAMVGRCLNDRIEATGAILAHHRAVSGDGRDAFGGSVGAIYNFAQQGNLIPFVSAGAGILAFDSNGETDKALLVPMLRAGFRTMIGETRSLNVTLGFQHEHNAKSTVEKSANMFEVGIGLSLLRLGN